MILPKYVLFFFKVGSLDSSSARNVDLLINSLNIACFGSSLSLSLMNF